MDVSLIQNAIPDHKELQVLCNRLKKKMAGKTWNLGLNCQDKDGFLQPTLLVDGEEEAQATPEHLAFLALAVLSASIDYDKQAQVGKYLHRIGKLLLRIWDDQEKERAILLN